MGRIRIWLTDPRPYRLLAVLWMAFIFYLSSRSDLPAPSLFSGEDKVAHAAVFGLLGLLYVKSLWPGGQALSLRKVFLITAMVAAYGAADEIHQTFVLGREAGMADLAADALGGLAAGMVFWRGSPLWRFLDARRDKAPRPARGPLREGTD